MAVAFVAAGAQTADTAAAAVALPAGISTGDILLLCVEECNLPDGSISDGGGGTWAEIATATTTATLTNRAISRVYWSRYDGVQTDPTYTPPANHFQARIVAYSGCVASGDPYEGVDTQLDESGDANLSFAVTTNDTSSALMVILAAASKDDNPTFGATWSNASLSSINIRVSDTTTAGNDGSLDVVEGVLASPGDKGTWTNTLTGTANSAGVCFGLKPAASSTQLVIADATHAHAADNLALTQHNVLAIQDASHGHAADNLALTQHNVLAIQDATHGHTADSAVLGVGLVVQDALHAHTADNLALTQHHVLAIADATHGHTAENQALTQHNILAIQDATHGHAADNLALTQHNVLAVADATHAHAADNLALTAHDPPGGDTLEIQDAAHAHTADALVLGVGLVIADATHGHAADNLELTQHNVLAIADALHAHTAEVPQLSLPGETPTQQDFVRLRRRRGMGTR